MMLRYFWWVQVYHFTTFYRQKPWTFIVGVIMAPFLFFRLFAYPIEMHREMVGNGIKALKSYWQVPGILPLPPKFIEKRFLALESEISQNRSRR